MKQFQFEYTSPENLRNDLYDVRASFGGKKPAGIVFHVYSELQRRDVISDVCGTIKNIFPYALYIGCSTSGNIMEGNFYGSNVVVVCTIYEKHSTKTEVMQYPLSNDLIPEVTADITEYIKKNPWIKTVEMLVTIRGISMTRFCEGLNDIPKNIQVFGGGAFSPELVDTACVFSNKSGYSPQGVVFLLTGGEDYHALTTRIIGWKPLGRAFHVTRAKDSVLYELDGKSAFDIYNRYLSINNDEYFFVNSLEFPIIYQYNGIDLLRAPIASNPDGSLVMTADLEENVDAHLSYGDPETILTCVKDGCLDIKKFQPDTISVFSCAGRRIFWGDEEIGNETAPLRQIAPTSGFYTSGEFQRIGDYVILNNSTLVISAQREGTPEEIDKEFLEVYREENFTGRVSMINRFAKFIAESTKELEEANSKLAHSAITDGLTELFNRAEIQHRISKAMDSLPPDGVLSLIMLDIDDFKKVNDTYGHDEGDSVIRGIASILRKAENDPSVRAEAGRWGGEEFMLLLKGIDSDGAYSLSEKLRAEFSDIGFPKAGHKTFSAGVTQAVPGEEVKTLCTRVDDALYEAKRTGKNKTVTK